MLCWPLYSAAPASRFLASSVGAAAGLQFALVGAGVVRNDALVASSSVRAGAGHEECCTEAPPHAASFAPDCTPASLPRPASSPRVQRTGDPRELLRGPLLYAAVLTAATVLLWRTTPAAALVVGVLCGGDGLAEVVGRGVASRGSSPLAARLPHNPAKTVAGSLACWLGGAATSLPLLLHFRSAGFFGAAAAAAGTSAALYGPALLVRVLACAAVGAAVESLPLGEADNVAVPLATALAARLAFGF